MDPQRAFVILLKNYRLNSHITQKQVAEMLGMKNIYNYQGLEKESNPSFKIINQQPRPKGTRYVVLIRYLYSGFNTFFKRPKGRGIKPLNTNKIYTVFPEIKLEYLFL
ncbi:conserved hypothetical protein [Treponema primitia ZAS-2]|uniref:Uncharacterized protein n=1 Tax=Treponema primitia (strain ATCC BAA-887 / DSM 12427 / ZAS-2) TaxID=545694 RepID=F5YHA5_TREPZ|nr:conserved hypothetical protein [Treponema primitia ZAS-2]